MKVFRQLRQRLRARSLASNARNAAEGTYETIRQAVIYAGPSSRAEVEERILARLGTRRSWRRVSENTFAVRWLENERTITVGRPLDLGRFFRDVTEAEIAVFSAGAMESELTMLQEVVEWNCGDCSPATTFPGLKTKAANVPPPHRRGPAR